MGRSHMRGVPVMIFCWLVAAAKAVKNRMVVPASSTSKTAGLVSSKRIMVWVSRASARLLSVFSPSVSASITKARLDSLLEEGSGMEWAEKLLFCVSLR